MALKIHQPSPILTRRTLLGTGTAALASLSFLAACSNAAQQVDANSRLQSEQTGIQPQETGLPPATIPQALGVNIHLDQAASAITAMLKQIASVGFHFVRIDMTWQDIESKKGKYDFTTYDRLMNVITPLNLRPIFILDYDNPLYEQLPAPPGMESGPRTDSERRAFAAFAGAAAARFKGRGVVWEIWNEPNNPRFWYPAPSADDYMALARPAISTIRRVDPTATIIGPGWITLSSSDQWTWPYLERCLQLGLADLLDALSIHPYRTSAPESVSGDYQRIRSLIAKYARGAKKSLPIVCSEWGYPVSNSLSATTQADFFVRQSLIMLMNGTPLSIWYEWRNDGNNPNLPEENYGLLTTDNKPKPAYSAAQTLLKELSGFRYTRRQALSSGNDYALVFSQDSSNKYVVWTTGSQHTVTLAVDGSSVTITDLSGKKRTVQATNGKITLNVTESPQYVG